MTQKYSRVNIKNKAFRVLDLSSLFHVNTLGKNDSDDTVIVYDREKDWLPTGAPDFNPFSQKSHWGPLELNSHLRLGTWLEDKQVECVF